LSLRSGSIIGSGIGGLPGIEKATLDYHVNKKKISPFFITGRLINMAAGYASLKYNLKGPNYSTVSACASGAHAIGESVRLIQSGKMDLMLTGGTEDAISPIGIEGFTACKALSTKYNEEPSKASRPFDEGRDGFVMGEGAGILILEEYEHAVKRGANIYCEIIGYGMSADAYHYTLPEPTGDGAKRAMEDALNDALINTAHIDYINAHGTSTPAGDQVEIKAIQDVFQANTDDVCISSTKSQTGHLLGAAGAIEAIFSVLSIKNQIMPATINLENPIEHNGINIVKGTPKKEKIDYVLSNSFGFGGTNVSLIFKSLN
jgi:3-oxoacyl-[acyl-carrier-protein] synthase II